VTLAPLLDAYDHVLLDLDGCLWVGGKPTPGAAEAVAALRAAGKGVAFVTNDSKPAPEEFVKRLWRVGFRASLEEVVTVGGAVQHVLADTPRWRAAYVIGSPAIHRHVADAGKVITNGRDVPIADVVVVAAHPDFHYDELRGATRAVLAGADLLCAGRDATFPMPGGPWPATGAVIAAVEAATGATATNVGKPAAQLFHTALDRLGPGRALVVGDRLDSDLAGARAAGLDAAIVLTGATAAADAHAAGVGRDGYVAVAASLAELVLGPSAPS
jgi:HAD superfamily hydrolase (TIGR01450 family)